MHLFQRRHNVSGFDRLVEDYQIPVYNLVRRMVISHDDACDVVQETFIRVYRNLPQALEAESPRRWIMHIAVNESLRHLAALRKRRNLSIDDTDPSMLERLTASQYVDFDNRMAIDFQRAILSLSELQRTVFNLRYYEEMTYDEIGSILGRTPDTAKSTYHVAKEKIKQYINNL